MRVPVNSMTQDEFNKYLERVVECAFREGMLWAQCGGEKVISLSNAIRSAQLNIVYDGQL